MKNKKFLLWVTVLVLTLAFAASGLAITNYYVKANSVRVRLYPDSDSEVIGHLSYGDTVGVEAFTTDGWAQIVYGSYGSGYVASRYVTRHEPGPKPTPKPTAKPKPKTTAKPSNNNTSSYDLIGAYQNMSPVSYTAEIHPAATYINFRWAPSTSAPVIGTRYEGDRVTVLAQDNIWAQVYDTTTDQCGFIQRQFLLPVSDGVGSDGGEG